MTRYRLALATVAVLIVAAVSSPWRQPAAGRARRAPAARWRPVSVASRGAGLHRHRRLDQQPAADPRRPARQGGPHRFLDVLVRQLRAHHPPSQDPLQRLQERRVRHRRRPLPGVRLREGPGQRRSRRSNASGITWPVAIDSQMATWNAYQNEYWPAEYLLDQQGRIAYTSFGEGDYAQTDAAVAQLLNVHDRGAARIDAGARQHHARALRRQRARASSPTTRTTGTRAPRLPTRIQGRRRNRTRSR